jgi:hydroxypyruvate isomerase
MPRFSANLTMLFTELPFLDRFAAAAAAGFRAVEFQFPYDFEVDELKARIQRYELEVDLFNLPAGDFAAGERGVAVIPARREEFRRGVHRALRYAAALGTRKVNCLVGLRDDAIGHETQYHCAVENLRWAAARAAEAGLRLLVEQLNPIETPNFFLDELPLAERILADVQSADLRLQFDVYHVQRTQGNVVDTLRRLIDQVGHVQIADSPGRGEPGTGELNYRYILTELDRLGYSGRVGLEYRPTRSVNETFHWISEYGWRIDG